MKWEGHKPTTNVGKATVRLGDITPEILKIATGDDDTAFYHRLESLLRSAVGALAKIRVAIQTMCPEDAIKVLAILDETDHMMAKPERPKTADLNSFGQIWNIGRGGRIGRK